MNSFYNSCPLSSLGIILSLKNSIFFKPKVLPWAHQVRHDMPTSTWERFIFLNDQYLVFLQSILCWYKFIDDLFLVWTGSLAVLKQLIKLLNINYMNLLFTFSTDDTQIPFLNLLIIKNSDGTLGTNLYHKPTAGNTLLHASSAHSKTLVRSIPYA